MNLPKTFRRLIARKTGPSFSSVAEIEELPMFEQPPGPGQVLIKVAYAGINGGCETFRVRGEFAFSGNITADSFTLGAEGAGTIVAVGPDVPPNLLIGQAVTFVGGAFSEYVVAKAMLCWPVKKPSPETVALTISGTVANAALRYVARMKQGDTILVTASGGATGSFAVQLAKLAKCRVVATCGTEEKEEKLKCLGLDRVINYTKEDVESVIREEFGGKIEIAYEGVGGKLQKLAWENLKSGGRLLAVGYISEYPHVEESVRLENEAQKGENLPKSSVLFWGGQTVALEDSRVIYGNVWPSDRAETLAAKQELFELYDRGEIVPWIDQQREFKGLARVPAAVEWMLSGKAVGKVVVDLTDG